MLVIADDLSGALDTGIKFRLRGLPTVVVGARGAAASLRRYLDAVVVFNSDSRHLDPARAMQVMTSLARIIHRHDPHAAVYKKIDSTLRGNIGAELAALQHVWPQRHMVVAPALPAQGRTVQGGRLAIRGVPLHESEFAADPLNPITSSFVPEILSASGGLQGTVIAPQALAKALQESPGVWVVDAGSEADLALIAAACEQADHAAAPILVGSAGLAHHLRLSAANEGPRWIILNGSLNPVALAQTRAALNQKGATSVVGIALSGRQAAILSTDTDRSGQVSRESRDLRETVVAQILRAMQEGRHVCLHSVLDRADLPSWQAEYNAAQSAITRISAPGSAAHEAIPRALGRIVAALPPSPTNIVMVLGGDTALGLIGALRARAVRPEQEVAPGVVLSAVELAGGRSLRLITKAGGFGPEDLISRLMGEITL